MDRLLATSLAALLLGCQGADLEERVPAQPGGLLEVDLYMGEGLRPDQGWLEVCPPGRSPNNGDSPFAALLLLTPSSSRGSRRDLR